MAMPSHRVRVTFNQYNQPVSSPEDTAIKQSILVSRRLAPNSQPYKGNFQILHHTATPIHGKYLPVYTGFRFPANDSCVIKRQGIFRNLPPFYREQEKPWFPRRENDMRLP